MRTRNGARRPRCTSLILAITAPIQAMHTPVPVIPYIFPQPQPPLFPLRHALTHTHHSLSEPGTPSSSSSNPFITQTSPSNIATTKPQNPLSAPAMLDLIKNTIISIISALTLPFTIAVITVLGVLLVIVGEFMWEERKDENERREKGVKRE